MEPNQDPPAAARFYQSRGDRLDVFFPNVRGWSWDRIFNRFGVHKWGIGIRRNSGGPAFYPLARVVPDRFGHRPSVIPMFAANPPLVGGTRYRGATGRLLAETPGTRTFIPHPRLGTLGNSSLEALKESLIDHGYEAAFGPAIIVIPASHTGAQTRAHNSRIRAPGPTAALAPSLAPQSGCTTMHILSEPGAPSLAQQLRSFEALLSEAGEAHDAHSFGGIQVMVPPQVAAEPAAQAERSRSPRGSRESPRDPTLVGQRALHPGLPPGRRFFPAVGRPSVLPSRSSPVARSGSNPVAREVGPTYMNIIAGRPTSFYVIAGRRFVQALYSATCRLPLSC